MIVAALCPYPCREKRLVTILHDRFNCDGRFRPPQYPAYCKGLHDLLLRRSQKMILADSAPR